GTSGEGTWDHCRGCTELTHPFRLPAALRPSLIGAAEKVRTPQCGSFEQVRLNAELIRIRQCGGGIREGYTDVSSGRSVMVRVEAVKFVNCINQLVGDRSGEDGAMEAGRTPTGAGLPMPHNNSRD